ncbi:hypothetical protein CTAYLR_005016 [Chrysophaeum taylorii]|uniref:Uncharacterized protein n=1 Tax=Chrysophaeum taylorii TaxID=2483200 RepID=A0AAD7XK74_9STRA|nr:hypothetical protein CTAYLR_005016 [Chrysophaeum taylorii]
MMTWFRVFFLLCPSDALRQVTWTAGGALSAPVSPSFQRWFTEDPSVPEALVAASDSVSEILPLGNDRFEARVSTTTFPLVTLRPIFTLRCARKDASEIVVTLEDQKMEVEGPAWATNIVLAATKAMDTHSTSKWTIRDQGELACEVLVESNIQIPGWIPIPTKVIQDVGQTSVAKQIDSDITTMLNNVVANNDRGA